MPDFEHQHWIVWIMLQILKQEFAETIDSQKETGWNREGV